MLILASPAGRDNTDDLFTILLLPVCMNYEQNVSGPRLNRDSAECVPMLLAGLIHAVQTDEPPLVLKDQRRQLE
jgi:hypothetical protein